jgi:hypothetical protein
MNQTVLLLCSSVATLLLSFCSLWSNPPHFPKFQAALSSPLQGGDETCKLQVLFTHHSSLISPEKAFYNPPLFSLLKYQRVYLSSVFFSAAAGNQ